MIRSRRAALYIMVATFFLWPSATQNVEVTMPEVVVLLETETITSEERDLIERVCYAEAGGEEDPVLAQMAVANVILDRYELWGLPDGRTITDIVTAKAQFAAPSRIAEVPAETKEAVSRIFDKGERVFQEPTTHFYAYNLVDPSWADTKVSRGTIGGHKFMY